MLNKIILNLLFYIIIQSSSLRKLSSNLSINNQNVQSQQYKSKIKQSKQKEQNNSNIQEIQINQTKSQISNFYQKQNLKYWIPEKKQSQQPLLLMDNSFTNMFILENYGNKITKAIKTQQWGWRSLKSANPLKDQFITQITIDNIKLQRNAAMFGIIANPDISQIATNHLGNFPNSWGLSSGKLHNLIAGKGPLQWLPYSPTLISGNVLTIRVDLTDSGVLQYFQNGVYLGVAFTGFKIYGKIYFALTLLSQWDSVQITNVKEYKLKK